MFRFNRRKSRHVGKIFYCLAEQLISHQPVTYKALITRGDTLQARAKCIPRFPQFLPFDLDLILGEGHGATG